MGETVEMAGAETDYRVVRAVLAPLLADADLETALAECAEAIVTHLGGAAAGIWLVSGDGRSVELVAQAGPDALSSDHHRVRLGESKVGRIAEDRVPLLSNDLQNDVRVGDLAWARSQGLVGFAGYPLLAGRRLVGVVGLYSRTVQDRQAVDAMASVADLLAVGIERRRAENESLNEARTVESLYRIGTAIAAERELTPIVQLVTDAATDLTGARFGAFFYNVIDEAGESYMLYTLSGDADAADFAGFPLPRNTPIFEPTFSGGPTVRSDDITRHPLYGQVEPYHGMPPGHLPVRSYLAASVSGNDGTVIGGLFFGHPEPGRFNERHERIVEGIAGHAAVAVEGARLYQETQTIALTLQQSLLPEALPAVNGVTLAARYVAAAENADVGGDWYDALDLGDGRVALTVGDVAGHDIHAAGTMGQLRTAMSVYAHDRHDPSSALQHLDTFMAGTRVGSMATALHATLNVATLQLTISSAGHPPGVLLTADGDVRVLDCALHPPLGFGFLTGTAPRNTQFDLQPGSTVVFYTDGLIERRGELFDEGLARLQGVLESCVGLPPDDICDHVLKMLTHGQQDDVVVLAATIHRDRSAHTRT